jgi:trimeric autotransporter adhesin
MAYKRISPIPVPEGGTGDQSFTSYAVICAGTTPTGSLQDLGSLGTSGQVLTSQGPGLLAQWADASGAITSVTGTTNQIDVVTTAGDAVVSLDPVIITPGSLEVTSTLTVDTNMVFPALTTATTGAILIGATPYIHNYGPSDSNNMFAGFSSGNLTLSGGGNTGFGTYTLANITNDVNQTAIGSQNLSSSVGGSYCTAIGSNVGIFLVNGQYTTLIGSATTSPFNGSGNNYTGAESYNICINNPGVLGENNTIRIGNPTDQNYNYQAGILGVTVGGTLTPNSFMVVDSNGQLGQSVLTSLDGSVTYTQTDNGHLDLSVPGFTPSVLSVAGTANQIDVSPTTGNAIVSLDPVIIFPGTGQFPTNQTLAFGTEYFAYSQGDPSNFFINSYNASTGSTDVNNIGIGVNTLTNLQNLNSTDNLAFGVGALELVYQQSVGNIAVGSGALNQLGGSGTYPSYNVAIGYSAYSSNYNPQYCIGIGYQAGINQSGSVTSSNNIYLNSPGSSSAESNVMRLGAGTGSGTQQLASSFISGIQGSTVAGTLAPFTFLVVDGSDQVGQSTFTSLDASIVFTQTDNGHLDMSAVGGGSGVNSVNGTANQITSSNTGPGSTTLSTPSTFIAPGSIEATTSITADTIFNTPTTSPTVGQYQINGVPVLHVYGTDNTFVGAAGNLTLTTGSASGNTALGSGALHDVTTGDQNLANGSGALFHMTTGSNNVAVGNEALDTITTGSNNIGIGSSAGSTLTLGDHDNIHIMNANNTFTGDTYTLRIGDGTGTSSGNLNAAFIAGIHGITVTGAAVLVSTSDQLGVAVSSRRFKDNIEDMGDYSRLLMALRPVTFTYKVGDDRSVQSGLIAEEVDQLMPQLVVKDKEGLPQTVKYQDLAVLLLNELQRLDRRVAELEVRHV